MFVSPMPANHTSPSFDLAAVKRAIADLPRADRARLQSWILARFDVHGYPSQGSEQLEVETGRRDEAQ
jgi:hypothetical protein